VSETVTTSRLNHVPACPSWKIAIELRRRRPTVHLPPAKRTGNPAQLTLSDKTVVTLKKSCAVDLQALSLRLGIISNVDTPWTQKELAKLLEEAGLQGVFEPELIIASTDAGAEKPGKRIYIYAAERAKVAVSACVFVGENLAEVIGAQVAGMHGQLKPVPVHYADL